MVVGRNGARNKEWLCWRGTAAKYFSALYFKSQARSWDSSVCTVTRLLAGLSRNRSSILVRNKTFFSSPHLPDQLRGREQSDRGVKLTTHLHLEPSRLNSVTTDINSGHRTWRHLGVTTSQPHWLVFIEAEVAQKNENTSHVRHTWTERLTVLELIEQNSSDGAEFGVMRTFRNFFTSPPNNNNSIQFNSCLFTCKLNSPEANYKLRTST
jgi:hypothetical protein